MMRKRVVFLAFALAAIGLLVACRGSKEPSPSGGSAGSGAVSASVIGIEELARLDLLPRLKRSVKVGLVSSYDRSGGNDDGFSGKYSFVRKEPGAGGAAGGLVLADLEGPGAIYRIHTPTPTSDIVEFYFDGEDAPRLSLKVIELFDGTRAPFVEPVVGSGVGGYTSYVPLTYRRSCRVVLKAETFQFYDINYAVYPAGADVATYEDPPSADFMAKVERAAALMIRAGTDISDVVAPARAAGADPSGAALSTRAVRTTLRPGGAATLFKGSGPGRIVGLRLGPAAELAGVERDILIRMYWDGAPEPAVECPVGDFFGASFGDPAVRSLMLGTAEDGRNYIYFPMPYERSARIELVSERRGGSPVAVEAEIVTAPVGKTVDEGRFYARWRRENPCATGRPYTFLRTTGRGHVVGVILQAQGLESGSTIFFEGDDRAVIDGDLAVPGTGSEDSFNGGWYDVPGRWERRTSLPLSGCLDYKKPLARTGGYRFMLTDAYAYAKSIDYTIEHGPEGNAVATDYASVVFFYSQDPPPLPPPSSGERLPSAEARRVTAPDRIVFVPGWNVPIYTTSLRNAEWSKATSTVRDGAGGGGAGGETRVRHFSMHTAGEDVFGPHHVSFICDLPEAGRYMVSVKAVLGPEQGILRLFERDRPVGEAANLYAAERTLGAALPLGVFEMKKGENIVYLYIVGADPRSKGTGLDLVEIIFERQR
jgi:hypothetical protein